MQGVLACIDTNGVSDCSGCLMGHDDVLLVHLSPRSFSERFGREHGRSSAARLAAIPAGASPANRGVQTLL